MDQFNDTAFRQDRGRTAFDFSFNFILVIIMINIVSGLIIDTFGALRDQDQEKNRDKKSNCFICGLKR